MFKVGDSVRINDQEHEYCGAYGSVKSVDGEILTIETQSGLVEQATGEPLTASQSQVEAN